MPVMSACASSGISDCSASAYGRGSTRRCVNAAGLLLDCRVKLVEVGQLAGVALDADGAVADLGHGLVEFRLAAAGVAGGGTIRGGNGPADPLRLIRIARRR